MTTTTTPATRPCAAVVCRRTGGLFSARQKSVLLSVDAENDDDDDEQESCDGHDAQWPRVPPSSPPPPRTTTTTVPSRCTLLAWSRVEVLSLKSFDVLMEPRVGIYLFSLSGVLPNTDTLNESLDCLRTQKDRGFFCVCVFPKEEDGFCGNDFCTQSARFFSFSIKRATTKKKVVSATGSGSVYIVVFKRRFLDVLTLLVEKARRSFF